MGCLYEKEGREGGRGKKGALVLGVRGKGGGAGEEGGIRRGAGEEGCIRRGDGGRRGH